MKKTFSIGIDIPKNARGCTPHVHEHAVVAMGQSRHLRMDTFKDRQLSEVPKFV